MGQYTTRGNHPDLHLVVATLSMLVRSDLCAQRLGRAECWQQTGRSRRAIQDDSFTPAVFSCPDLMGGLSPGTLVLHTLGCIARLYSLSLDQRQWAERRSN